MSVIAFIPVRGGSKSIPLKNIKLFCGKPLVCWCIEALERCQDVDRIVVATDSTVIWNTIAARNYRKTELYHRSVENASDTASTESVMLEYIEAVNLNSSDTFMLVQATSPLTQTIHFSEAIQKYKEGQFDSILSCVRNYRFFWSEDGQSLNYDYRFRPRRQDFHGILMENGAFYLNRVANIIESKNRLSGKIGVYEMPEYTATEIDEPDDWIILEQLMYRYVLAPCRELNSVKLFLCDVDGTLTDGGMYYSENGDELKKFNTRDGVALSILKSKGIKTGLITSENTKIVARRAEKLKIDFLVQGKKNGGKIEAANEICQQLGIHFSEVAYIGDDINCIELLSAVGFAACPADAVKEVLAIPGIHICNAKGGDGVIREIVNRYLW